MSVEIDYNISHSGANWVRSTLRMELSPLGEKVANILGWICNGIYHIEFDILKRVNWGHDYFIEVKLPYTWATYDFDNLTALVVAAHDMAVRVQIAPSSRQYIQLMFHDRGTREGRIFERHPTIEQAIERIRARR